MFFIIKGGIFSAEVVLISFLLPILEKNWNLNSSQLSSIGSFEFLGMLIGSIISGYLGDNFGRINIIIITNFILVFITIITAFSFNLTMILIIKLIFGLFSSINTPISLTLLSEIIRNFLFFYNINFKIIFKKIYILAVKLRGKVLVFAMLLNSIIMLFLCLIAYFIFSNSNNWRLYQIISGVPIFIASILSLFCLYESPRYLLITQKFEKGINIINKVGKINNSQYEDLNQIEMESLVCWTKTFNNNDEIKQNFIGVISGFYC